MSCRNTEQNRPAYLSCVQRSSGSVAKSKTSDSSNILNEDSMADPSWVNVTVTFLLWNQTEKLVLSFANETMANSFNVPH